MKWHIRKWQGWPIVSARLQAGLVFWKDSHFKVESQDEVANPQWCGELWILKREKEQCVWGTGSRGGWGATEEVRGHHCRPWELPFQFQWESVEVICSQLPFQLLQHINAWIGLELKLGRCWHGLWVCGRVSRTSWGIPRATWEKKQELRVSCKSLPQ